MHRLASIAVAATALLAPAHASAAETLIPATACPTQGPHRACIMTDITPPRDVCSMQSEPYSKTYTVNGRLNGGPPRRYRIDLTGAGWRPAAYLGQSTARRPLTLTNQGVLEILDAKWSPGSPPTYIVDERSWKINGRFFHASGEHPIVTSANDIGYWDEDRKLCISARLEPGRRLRIIENGCTERPRERTDEDLARERRERAKQDVLDKFRDFAQWYKATANGDMYIPDSPSGIPSNEPYRHWLGNVEPAPVSLARLRKLLPKEVNDDMGSDDSAISDQFGGGGTGIRIVRIKDSKTMIVTVSYDGDGC